MFRPALALLFLGTTALAQPPKAAPAPNAPVTVDLRKLTVGPAPAPVPALTYELLPRLRDRVPGNAALIYARAHALRPSWPRDPAEGQKLQEKLIAWEDTPVDKLPLGEVKKYLSGHAQSFRALDDAAKCERCDWELAPRLSVNNIDMLLPEVQTYRELARFQKLRLRVALADGDIAGAVEIAQAVLRLGRDVGEGPTMLHALVGIAITTVALGTVEEIAQRPGGPNFYWALTTLPRPLIDPRASLEGEARLFDNLFPNAKALGRGPVSEERAKAVLADMVGAFQMMGGAKAPIAVADIGPYVAKLQAGARNQLIGFGLDPVKLDKMPAAQVVALRTVVAYRVLNDDALKCAALPCPEARAEFAKLKVRAKEVAKEAEDPAVTAFALNVPATEKVLEAHMRLNRRVALMRAVEAVRLHAAANGGKPPSKLDEVKLVPVPLDPYTEKPFVYDATGDTFGLTAPPPPGEQPGTHNHIRFEVTLRPK